MDLKKLREDVLNVCDRVLQNGHDLEDIKVCIQIDDEDNEYMQSGDPSVNYDDNGDISGCVIFGYNTTQKEEE